MKDNLPLILVLCVTFAIVTFAGGFYLGSIYQDDAAISVSAPVVDEPTEDTTQSNKLNLNTATKEELMELPGIGEKLSEAILTYRDSIGEFRSIWQLDGVPGIGEATVKRLEPYLTLS